MYVYLTSDFTNPVTKEALGSGMTLDKCGDKIIGVEFLSFLRIQVGGRDIIEERDKLYEALQRIASERCFIEDIMGSPCRERGPSYRLCGACIANETLQKLRG
jgi:hypothetical protein